ncbi:hypothetical protein ACLKA6_009198 [Drosophila palustris]
MIAIGNSVSAVYGTVLRRIQIRGKHRLLATFDFDNTIINGDCYEAVGSLLNQPQETTEKLTSLIKERNWIIYMQSVVKLMHEQGVNSTEMLQQVRHLPEVPGMMCLLRRLANKSSIDMCILSDANSLFITEWLKANKLGDIFTAIYTNPARVGNDGYLQVDPYEQQTHCDLCPKNLCKGSVIKALMNCTENNFNRIIYVGDSCNDLCPILCMRQQDVACIRRDEELHKKLPSYVYNIRAQVLIWRDGHELQHQLVSSGIL